MNTNQPYTKVLRSIAMIALAFAFIMCMMVIINYYQLSRMDPVNSELIDQLVQRLNENPEDQALRTQIRELDLLARKAYFTNTWQVRTGGYLILIALAIFFIIYQLLEINIRRQVDADPDVPKDVLGIQKNAQRGIAGLGIVLVLVAMFLSFIKPHPLTEKLKISGKQSNVPSAIAPNESNRELDSSPSADDLETTDSQNVLVLLDSTRLEADVELLTEEEKNNTVASTKPDVPNVDNDREKPAEKKPARPYPSAEEIMQNASSFRGFNGNGIVYQSNIPVEWDGPGGKNILWKAAIPIKAYNSPIIWKDKIFLTGANEQKREVYCFDKTTGKILWTHSTDDIPGSPAVPPKTTADTGLGAPTMTTDGQRVYAIFGTGDLIALDFSGNRVWAKNLGVPDNHYGHSSSLLMYREKLIVQYDQKKSAKIMAFNGATGTMLWSTDRDVKISWASPVIINYKGEPQVVLAADPAVAAYDPRNGRELWRTECIYGEVGPSVCYDDGMIFAVNDYAQIAAISLDNPSETAWTDSDILSDIPSPVASDGLLIMPTSYGLLGCYDAKNGELLWEHEFDENSFASPILIGKRVYLLDTKGTMHIFRLSREGFESIATNNLGEDAVATPAFADGRIYIRTDKHLYCIGKK